MPSLFKYLDSKYLESFFARGEVLFRSVSYFRNLEETEVRGDRHEGIRLFSPSEGLEVRKNGAIEATRLQMAFEAKIKERDIFVFCLSTCLSPELAAEFNADVCIELKEPNLFIAAVQRALVSRPSLKSKSLTHGPVTYYEQGSAPFEQWALPEKVVLSKLAKYERQAEYRLAFGRRKAFDANNVQTQLTSRPGIAENALEFHSKTVLAAGSLKSISKVHLFP